MARQLALVSEVEAVSADELHKIAAALQKQLDRDFTPLWDIKAAIKSFTSLEDVPENCWPVILRTDIETPGALAVHLNDQKGMPFALVQFGDGWSLSASHQVLEMLANPFSNRLLARRSVKPGERHNVQYLVQVCDPCQNAAYAYHIDGIMVSDFYTPHYFDLARAPGVRYSFSGGVKRPVQVLKGGYLSWHDPITGHWWQETWFGRKPEFRDLGVFDQQSSESSKRHGQKNGSRAKMLTVMQMLTAVEEATASRIKQWQNEFDELIRRFGGAL